jgi:hypothetical protein
MTSPLALGARTELVERHERIEENAQIVAPFVNRWCRFAPKVGEKMQLYLVIVTHCPPDCCAQLHSPGVFPLK